MQKKPEEILTELAALGFRVTRLRRAILSMFGSRCMPLSADEIMQRLRDAKTGVNKTTVYREIAFLKERGIIQEVQFMHERVKRYEPASAEHHHHLVCLSCKRVEEIVLQGDLDREERRILRSRGFKVLNHSLEFHGLCQACR